MPRYTREFYEIPPPPRELRALKMPQSPMSNPPMSKPLKPIALSAAAALLAGALYTLWPTGGSPSAPSTPIVTAAEFDQIQLGMSYEDCTAIIGAGGTPYGASAPPEHAMANTEWVSFVWHNSRDSSAEITFNYGIVESKRAHALP